MIKYFVKQYGAQRTGTNVLRLMLTKHFKRVEVLMHTLGDKHSPPIDYDFLKKQLKHSPDPYEAIHWATNFYPSETTDMTDPGQTEFLRAISIELASAILENRLLFFISIKNPYSWAYSFLKYRGLLSNRKFVNVYLAAACHEFNQNYASWMALCDKFPQRSQIILYEDLIEAPKRLFISVKNQYHIDTDNSEPLLESEIVMPTHWDNSVITVHFESFDKSLYTSKAYYNLLKPSLIKIIQNSIDWTLMGRFGYYENFKLK